ncbi:MAG TPA: hypothetical protein VLV86_03700 [Vicinamibacterales bacterium]|nr:hypothetical protein [Vicinamibacterales bacterium]
MRHVRAAATVALAGLLLAVTPALAHADATLFIGANTSPANRTAKGVAIGGGFTIIGFEFEYSDTTDDVNAGAPSLKTGTGNLLLQTPVAFAGFQPYFEVGGGVYHEELSTISNTGFAGDTGAGVKISLIGPIRLRVDYRAFTLKNGALATPAHRIYAGVNLKF